MPKVDLDLLQPVYDVACFYARLYGCSVEQLLLQVLTNDFRIVTDDWNLEAFRSKTKNMTEMRLDELVADMKILTGLPPK